MDTSQSMILVPPPPSRFTINEWHLNNRFRCSDGQQELADRVLCESKRVCQSAEEIAKTNKKETDFLLSQKIGDIEFRRKELLRVRKEIVLELDALLTYKERILDTLASIRKNALIVCQKCLIAREQRVGIELVRDDVEKELINESSVIKGAENLLVRTLEQTQEGIRKLKAALYRLDRNLEEKDSNLKIENHNLTLKETSLNLSLYHGTSKLDLSNVSLNEWDMESNEIILASTKELNNARPLRNYVDAIIQQAIDDLKNQKALTDEAFRRRIEETKEIKTKLELKHAEVMRRVNEMTDNITGLKKSLAEKEGFMALAHTRLGNRCQRPGLEMTRDSVEFSLVKEVSALRNAVSNLQQMLCEAEASMRYLLKTQIQIEEDINVKLSTLKIDEVECMTLRQSIIYHAY